MRKKTGARPRRSVSEAEACRGPGALWEGASSPDQLIHLQMRRVFLGSVLRQLSAPCGGPLPPPFPACLLSPSPFECSLRLGRKESPLLAGSNQQSHVRPAMASLSLGSPLMRGCGRRLAVGGLRVLSSLSLPGRQWAGSGLLSPVRWISFSLAPSPLKRHWPSSNSRHSRRLIHFLSEFRFKPRLQVNTSWS